MISLNKLIGLTVQAVRGSKTRNSQVKNIVAEYICFDDRKTILSLNEQDYVAYHDCSPFARELRVEENAVFWSLLMDEDSTQFADATEDW